jgi:predicted N-acyltransferase
VKKEMSLEDLIIESDSMKELFHNVFNKSKFNAAKFNTDVFYDLKSKKKNVSIYGYYLKDVLIGFASDISINQVLYAHFVGLNYEVNQTHEIYSLMLYEQIDYAIKNKLQSIKFGRTAAEFKSNIGAIPKNDKAYVYHKNKVVLKILKPILSLLKPKNWIQRNPFK